METTKSEDVLLFIFVSKDTNVAPQLHNKYLLLTEECAIALTLHYLQLCTMITYHIVEIYLSEMDITDITHYATACIHSLQC